MYCEMTPSVSVPTSGLCLKYVGETYKRQQRNSLSQLSKYPKHQWRGNWLCSLIPNQVKIENHWTSHAVSENRRICTNWTGNCNLSQTVILSRQSPRRRIRNPTNLKLITRRLRIMSLPPGNEGFASSSFTSRWVINLKAVLSSYKSVGRGKDVYNSGHTSRWVNTSPRGNHAFKISSHEFSSSLACRSSLGIRHWCSWSSQYSGFEAIETLRGLLVSQSRRRSSVHRMHPA